MADQPLQKPLTVLEGFKSFLVWVGGSLAGITAILYACGYLVTRAHLSMLGLYGLVEYGNEHFLQEGSKFLLAASFEVVRTLLPIAVGIVILAVAWVALGPLRRRVRLTRIRSWLRGNHDVVRRAAFGLLFVALLWHTDRYLDAFGQPLSVGNVLYTDPAGASEPDTGTSAQIKDWILCDARGQLGRWFHDLLYGTLLAAILTLLAWRMVHPWRLRGWLAAPFLAALLLYLVMLPMAYGVLQRPVRYSVVSLTAKPDAGPSGGTLFLLALTGEAFVVWDSGTRRVAWIPVGSVARAEIRAVGNLFSGKP